VSASWAAYNNKSAINRAAGICFGMESARNCTANKIAIKNLLSMGYEDTRHPISAFRRNAFNSHQPFTSKCSILW
jgi:hypothetical protein